MSQREEPAVQEPLETGYLSHEGGRETNQDRYGFVTVDDGGSGCWVVADGLGGHRGGETAAFVAVEAILGVYKRNPVFSPETILAGLRAAQQEILRRQEQDPKLYGMRTTAVVLLIDGDRALWGHIGDTRLYLFREGAVLHQTRDHSVTQALHDAGQIDTQQMRTDENRNRLTRVLGKEEAFKPVLLDEPARLEPEDAFLLCSDGFWEHVDEEEMGIDLAKSRQVSAQRWLDLMVSRLLQRAMGEYDNYTAVAVFCHPERLRRVAVAEPAVTEIIRKPEPEPEVPAASAPPKEPAEREPPQRERSRKLLLLVLAAVLVPLLVVWFFLLRARPPGEKPTNQPPEAVADAVSTEEQVAVTIPVIANDRDPDGDPLLLASVEKPQNGEVTWDEKGVLTYTPNEGFTGQERLKYEVTDGHVTVEGDVEIQVGPPSESEPRPPAPAPPPPPAPEPAPPPAPELPPPPAPELPPPPAPPEEEVKEPPAETEVRSRAERGENRPPEAKTGEWHTFGRLLIDLNKEVHDPDGDPLSIESVSPPANGKASLGAGGRVIYVPDPGFTGKDEFTYVVTDGKKSTTGTIRIQVGELASGEPNAGELRFFPDGLQYAWIPSDDGEGVKGFWLGTTEVTVKAFRKFTEADPEINMPDQGYFASNLAETEDQAGRHDNYPVIEVSWTDAKSFCEWSGGRLPAETEWRHAARGGVDGAGFPWGEEDPTCGRGTVTGANFKDCGKGMPVAVTYSRANGFNLYDMMGNVWEWIQGKKSGKRPVLGGSFNTAKESLLETRWRNDRPLPDVGFRCARDESP